MHQSITSSNSLSDLSTLPYQPYDAESNETALEMAVNTSNWLSQISVAMWSRNVFKILSQIKYTIRQKRFHSVLAEWQCEFCGLRGSYSKDSAAHNT